MTGVQGAGLSGLAGRAHLGGDADPGELQAEGHQHLLEHRAFLVEGSLVVEPLTQLMKPLQVVDAALLEVAHERGVHIPMLEDR